MENSLEYLLRVRSEGSEEFRKLEDASERLGDAMTTLEETRMRNAEMLKLEAQAAKGSANETERVAAKKVELRLKEQDAAQAVRDATAALNDQAKELAENAEATERAGDGWATMQDAMALASDAIVRAIEVGGTAIEGMTGDYSKLGEVISAIPHPVAQAAGAITSAVGTMVNDTVKQVEAFDKLAEKTGASVEWLSKLSVVAGDANISQETLSKGLETFARKLGGVSTAEDGVTESGGKMSDRLQELGVKLKTTESGAIDMEDAFGQLQEVIAAAPEGAARLALQYEFLGKAGGDMGAVFAMSREELEGLMDAAERLGVTLNKDTVAQVKALDDQSDKLGRQFEQIKLGIVAGVLPALVDLTEQAVVQMDAVQKLRSEHGFLLGSLLGGVEGFKRWREILDGSLNARQAAEKDATALAAAMAEVARKAEDAARVTPTMVAALEAEREGFMNAAEAAGSLELASDKTRDAADRLSGAAYNKAAAIAEAARAADAAREGQARYSAALDESAAANARLIGAASASVEPLTKQERVMWLLKIATGEATKADLEFELGKRAVMKASKDGHITEERTIELLQGLHRGTLTVEQAMRAAGPAAAGMQKDLETLGTKADAGRDRVDKMSDAITRVPKSTKVTIAAQTDQPSIVSYADILNRIPRYVTTVVKTHFVTEGQPSQYVGNGIYVGSGGNPAVGGKPESQYSYTPSPGNDPERPRTSKASVTTVNVGGPTFNVNTVNAARLAAMVQAQTSAAAFSAGLAAALMT